jgi:hypothetical protein
MGGRFFRSGEKWLAGYQERGILAKKHGWLDIQERASHRNMVGYGTMNEIKNM